MHLCGKKYRALDAGTLVGGNFETEVYLHAGGCAEMSFGDCALYAFRDSLALDQEPSPHREAVGLQKRREFKRGFTRKKVPERRVSGIFRP